MKYFKTILLAAGISALCGGPATAQNTFPTPSGNVGIGTLNPTYPLHMYGVNPQILLEGNSGSYYSGIYIKSPMMGSGILDNYGAAALWGGLHMHTTTTTPTGSPVPALRNLQFRSTIIELLAHVTKEYNINKKTTSV